MTLQEYKDADIGTKPHKIKDKGVLIGKLVTDNEYLTCYAIDKFFVEVLFNSTFTEIVRFRPFAGGKQLDKYNNIKL